MSGYPKTKNILLNGSDQSRLYACNTVGPCTCCDPIIIRDEFEKPGYGGNGIEADLKRRRTFAKEIYDKLRDAKVPSGDDSGSGGNDTPTSGVDQITDGALMGKYTNSNGSTFYVYNQGLVSGWGTYCNRAATACILTGLKNLSKEQAKALPAEMDAIINKNHYSLVPTDAGFWTNYGLKLDFKGYVGANYQDMFRTALLNGKKIAFRISESAYKNSVYKGKSGFVYSHSGNGHWLAVVDYKKEDGKEMILVTDSGNRSPFGSGWKTLDEFTTSGGAEMTNVCIIYK